ncbi:MAG TPA: hypothetical protein VIF62_11040, partial [Labilithrix sp.]
LDLRLATAPFNRGVGMSDIFQMDIRRARRHDVRSEYFFAWSGRNDNVAHVLGVDRGERQVVMVVKERERAFEEAIPNHLVKWAKEQVGEGWRSRLASRLGTTGNRIVVRGDAAYLRRETQGATRHFLAGRDERQLFMCQLPQACTTVHDAHVALRPTGLKSSRSALDRPVRQGEWFFVHATKHEVWELETAIESGKAIVCKQTAINRFIPRAGKPHVADEIVGLGPDRVFVRGRIRHPDHATIDLRGWRKVLKNREYVDPNRNLLGGTWID